MRTLKALKRIRIRSLERYRPFVTTYLDFRCHAVDKSSFLFMADEIFTKEIYRFDCKSNKPTIIDAGANIGLSVLYWKKLYPEASIIAFEPDEEVYSVLERNIQENELTGVKLINKGIWNIDDTLNFTADGSDGGRISHNTDKQNKKINVTRLEPYLKNGPIDFLKIDIEGAETVVLEDCKNSLGSVKNIFVEYHSFVSEEQTLDNILTILKRAGFRIYIEHVGVYSPHPYLNRTEAHGMDLQLNIFGYRP